MAYDTQEERLKVQGSEQITRDLKVNRDAYINGSLNASGDIDIQGQVIARNDVSISGDLYVNGTEHINDSETSQTSDNYLVLRHNKTTALGNNEHAGIAVHNYSPNKTATCTVDNQGTWRVADNTETSTVYTNVSYFNGVYYAGLTTTTTTVANGIKTEWDEDELDECVYYSTSYYHFDGANWFAVGLSNNILTIGTQVTDATIITALEALTRYDLVYFRSLTVTVINEIENEPLLTRDETANLQNKDLLAWDSTAQKAVAAPRATADDQALVWKSGNYQWKGITDTVTSGSSDLVTSNAVANAIGTLDAASAGGNGKYISEISESDGIISATEGNIDTTVTSGSNNPVSSDAVANAINALDVASVGGNNKYIKAISETDGKISATEGTVDTTVTQNSSNLITSGAVYSAVQSITPQTVVNSVTVGNMNPVTSNAVALELANMQTRFIPDYEHRITLDSNLIDVYYFTNIRLEDDPTKAIGFRLQISNPQLVDKSSPYSYMSAIYFETPFDCMIVGSGTIYRQDNQQCANYGTILDNTIPYEPPLLGLPQYIKKGTKVLRFFYYSQYSSEYNRYNYYLGSFAQYATFRDSIYIVPLIANTN